MAAVALIRFLTASMCFVILVSASSATTADADEEYDFDVVYDDAKVSIISGNFSVRLTSDWPRVIFKHETDPFSPHFEISCPRMYSFNDTDDDGVFDPSEEGFTMFLDSNHVSWNVTIPEHGYDAVYGEYVLVGMDASIHAYVVGENETLAIPNWARLSFWFFVTETPVVYECPSGSYAVSGNTEMRMNFTLVVNECLDSDGLVLEQLLQGGGSTNIFQLVEGTVTGENTTTEVSGLVDERDEEGDYSHEFQKTPHPMQMIRFANEENVSKAFYLWESETEVIDGDLNRIADVNSSYYTTGAGMILHSVLPIDNCTTEVSHASTMGIYESGFIGSVRDWITEYFVPFIVMCAVIIIASLSLFIWRRKAKALRLAEESQNEQVDTP